MPSDPAVPIEVSVVLPVYKVPEDLPACLESILRYPGRDIEVVAVDDASPDDCGRVLEAHAARDDRLRVVHLDRNGGLGGP